MDVCCGSGDLAFLLSEKVGNSGKVVLLSFVCFSLFFIFLFHLLFKKLQVVGLDFSKEQLSIASSRQHSKSKTCYRNIK